MDADSLTLTMSGDAITAVWDHVSGAQSYHVTLKAQGAPGSPVDVNAAYPAFDGDGNAVNRKAGDATKMSLTIADAAATAGAESNTYWFGLRAANSAGSSAWKAKPVSPSAAPPSTTTTTVPQQPPADVDADSLTLAMSGSTITAEWDHVSDAESYHVTLKAQGGPGSPVDINTAYPAFDGDGNAVNRKTGDATKMSLTIADAAATAGHESGTYWFGLRAANSAGSSAWKAKPVSPAAPSLSVINVSEDSVTLQLDGYGGQWYYRQESGAQPQALEAQGAFGAESLGGNKQPNQQQSNQQQCVGPFSSQQANVGNLNSGTEYTFGAYSDGACTAESRIANAQANTWTESAYLAASNVTVTGATLELSDHTGNWWYKRTEGPASTTCHAVTSPTTTAALSGLTGGMHYQYVAYSASGCNNDDNVIAWRGFTTPGEHVYNWYHVEGSNTCNVGYLTSVSSKCATAFTTGNSSAGYTLSEIKARFAMTVGSPGDLIVKIHAADTGNSSDPASSAKVTLSSGYTDGDWRTFLCSGSSCELDKETKYFVVMSTADTSDNKYHPWVATTSNDEDVKLAGSGWSIADLGRTSGGSWSDMGSSGTGLLYVGAAAPSLTATNIADTSATLTFPGRHSSWWYKRTHPTNTSCAAGSSSVSLSTLTANTLYGYTAYSDSSCTDSNALDTEYFSTTDYDVGNLTEVDVDNCLVGNHHTGFSKCAIGFTTGTRSGGYTLRSVTGSFGAKAGHDNTATNNLGPITVAIHGDSGGSPAATALATLSGADPDTKGLYTYTCSANCDLDANTSYFVVMSTTDTTNQAWYNLRTTTSDIEARHPFNNGWSIADVARNKLGANAWADLHNSRTGVIHIAADVVTPVELTASSVTTTTATLTLTGKTAGTSWWLKKTRPSTGNCTAGESDFSHALSSLTAGTYHEYRAYSDSGCTASIARETFATDETVSNLDENSPGGLAVHNDFPRLAQAFTTGPNASGYTLKTVTIDLHSSSSSQTLTVTLHNAASNGNDPSGDALATLASGVYAVGEHTFTCSGSACNLDSGTTYVIQLAAGGPATPSYEWTALSTTNETNVPSTNGWSIGNRSRFFRASNSTWNDETVGATAALKLAATPKPGLSASVNSATSATLTIGGYSGSWYYKANTGPHTNCQGPVSGTTQTLSGLSGGTSYTYTAYSEGTCTQTVASHTFYTTLPAPTNLTWSLNYPHNINVGWSKPSGMTGAVSYEVEYATGGSYGNRTTVTSSSSTVSTTITLQATKFRVRTKVSSATSAWAEYTT